jgi:adenosylcobinamide-GDP ribazoletransferase
MKQASMNGSELVRERLAEFAAAFALLTRFPVPRQPLKAEANAAWAYPLVGSAIGALGGCVYWILFALSLPPALSAIFALLAMVLATGALHEDGLADFADGFAGTTPADRLSIMRDRRTGTYGATALIFSLALRATAVALIVAPASVLAALLVAGAAGRTSAVIVMASLPAARSDGLSAAVGRPSPKVAGAAQAIAFLVGWLSLSFSLAVFVMAIAAAVALLVSRYAQSKLGGQTGDVLGASSQITECLTLALLASV